jgi:hypothetical protein
MLFCCFCGSKLAASTHLHTFKVAKWSSNGSACPSVIHGSITVASSEAVHAANLQEIHLLMGM